MLTVGIILGFWLFPLFVPVKAIKDVPYIDGATSKAHQLDIYVPEYRFFWDNSRPLIVYIHGGAWHLGDKAPSVASQLPKFGYVAASVNYRFTNEAKFPAQLKDISAAVHYMQKNARKYGADPARIGVWGVSAGAQLAALVGLTDEPGLIRAVCDWCGPTDFATITQQADSNNELQLRDVNGPVSKLLGGLPDKVPTQAKLASPVNYARAGAPVFLILHGDADEMVPVQQSIDFARKLNECGVTNELHIIPGGKHDFTNIDTIKEVIDFFDKNLKS